MTSDSPPIIGIDLGTTNSLVAYADESGPHLIPGYSGDTDVILPSVLAIDSSGRATIGTDALAHAVERPRETIYSIKRLMGRSSANLQKEMSRLPYEVSRRPGDTERDVAAVVVHGRWYTPPELSGLILAELKKRAEKHLGQPISQAVITVPAHFDDAQRQATRDAGQIAGLDVLRIVNEPTAAALAYGLDRSEQATIAVYDFGGGTFDISILRLEDGVFEVLATDGDTHLGGDDLDHTIIDLVYREVEERFGIKIQSPKIKQQLRTLAEDVKKKLGDQEKVQLEIAIGKEDVYRREFTRSEFEDMIDPLVGRTIESCSRALKAAKLKPSEIDQVVMVGGSTRVPYVRRRVGDVFQAVPYTALNPEQVVAMGAAIQASILSGARRDMLLLDVTPLALGIETMGGAMGKLIMANTRIPCRATETFTTFQDGQTAVKINVLQGERELVENCRSLGVFELQDIPPMPAGIPKVDVTFLIDQNGILSVTAVEQRSGRNASVQIIPSHGLTREEVRQIQQEAFEHAREDMSKHHLIDVRTTVQFDLNKTERMIQLHGALLPEEERDALKREADALREFAQSCEDAASINEKREAFNLSMLPLAEKAMTETLKHSDR